MFARGLRWTDVVRRRKLMARQVTATVVLVSMSVLVALGMVAQPHWVTPATTLFIVLLGVFGLKQPGMIVLSAALLAQVIGLAASGLAEFGPEGFATAVRVAGRLDTGVFTVSTAGHPPAVDMHAGSGLIEPLDTTGGPALGIVEAPTFAIHAGVLEPGDTLMLYTDGLVETPGTDVELGIDRLMGEAERYIATRSGGADAVIAGVRAGDNDDRALLLLRRN